MPNHLPTAIEPFVHGTRLCKGQRDLARVASISVDPEYDTPERLTAKHEEIQASENWSFLTGTKDQVRTVVVEGFKTHMGEQEIMEDGLIEIGHGAKLMLIDREGVIRGLFGTEAKDADALVDLAKRLQN